MKTQLRYLTAVILTSFSLVGMVSANSAKVVNSINGHTYQWFDAPQKTWTNAKTACANLDGYLATVSSQSENNFVTTLATNNNTAIGTWLGGSDEVQEGSWRWVNDEAWSYSAWASGEPNNSGNEDYLYNLFGKWNDLNNTFELPYICEWDPVQYIHLTAIPDITGDSKSDIALLAKLANKYYLRTVNGTTGVLIKELLLGAAPDFVPNALTVVDDANANTYKEIGILYSSRSGSGLVLRDSLTGNLVKSLTLNN